MNPYVAIADWISFHPRAFRLLARWVSVLAPTTFFLVCLAQWQDFDPRRGREAARLDPAYAEAERRLRAALSEKKDAVETDEFTFNVNALADAQLTVIVSRQENGEVEVMLGEPTAHIRYDKLFVLGAVAVVVVVAVLV